jgi:hypothetical protein
VSVHGEHVDALGDRLDSHTCGLHVGGQVHLREDHHRCGARVPRDRKLSLDPAKVGLLGDGVDDEHRVDVRGQDLGLRGLSGVAARDRARALEHGLDDRNVEVVGGQDCYPVADGGQADRSTGCLQQIGGECRPDDAGRRRGQHAAAIAADDAGGHQTPRGIGREERLPARRPAESLKLAKVRQCSSFRRRVVGMAHLPELAPLA